MVSRALHTFDDEEVIQARSQIVLRILHDQVCDELGQPPHSVQETVDALCRVLCRWAPRESFAICGMLVQHGIDQYEP